MWCEMTRGVVLSCSDRIYVSAPGCILVAFAARVWAHGEPVAGINDHAPVIAQVMPWARMPRSQRRLPQWVARTPEYEQRLKAFELVAPGPWEFGSDWRSKRPSSASQRSEPCVPSTWRVEPTEGITGRSSP